MKKMKLFLILTLICFKSSVFAQVEVKTEPIHWLRGLSKSNILLPNISIEYGTQPDVGLELRLASGSRKYDFIRLKTSKYVFAAKKYHKNKNLSGWFIGAYTAYEHWGAEADLQGLLNLRLNLDFVNIGVMGGYKKMALNNKVLCEVSPNIGRRIAFANQKSSFEISNGIDFDNAIKFLYFLDFGFQIKLGYRF